MARPSRIITGHFLVLVLLTFLLISSSHAAPTETRIAEKKKKAILTKASSLQIPFIENKGQIKNQKVKYYAKTMGGTVFVEENGVLTYSLPVEDKKGVVIKEIFTDKKIKVAGSKPSSAKVSYFIGKEKGNWRSNIPSYGSISLGEVYKGIELTLKAYGNNVEKLFTVAPEKNPAAIRVKVDNAKGLKINEGGELEVITELAPVKFTKPLAYQRINRIRKAVEVAYVIYEGSTYGFQVGSYDKKRPLVIDPLLASTFIGGSNQDYGWSIAIGTSGNVYVTGDTNSSDYPTASGAYDESYSFLDDVFVSKFDNSLSSLLASTFIGGSGDDSGWFIAIGTSENVYVTGSTRSSDYPTTSGAYDESHNGGTYYDSDVFLSKLDHSLSSLRASTFIGGSNEDYGWSIAIGTSGNVFFTGATESSDYPTTSGAYDESYNGGRDVFVSNLDSSLSFLLASTFIGGSGGGERLEPPTLISPPNGAEMDNGCSSGFDSIIWDFDWSDVSGASKYQLYVIRKDARYPVIDHSNITTSSYHHFEEGSYIAERNRFDWTWKVRACDSYENWSDWSEIRTFNVEPLNADCGNESFNAEQDNSLSKLDSRLDSLLPNTFARDNNPSRALTAGDDGGLSISIDESGSIYVTGITDSSDYPTTLGAYDESSNGADDVFVSKLDSSLSSLLASTFIGGSDDDYGWSIVIDETGNVYVIGRTYYFSDYPTTSGAYDESHKGGWDVFVSKLDSSLSSLLASTFIGGSGYDYGQFIAIDGVGNVFVTGYTEDFTAPYPTTNYPTTSGAYDESHNGFYDVFVSKLDSSLSSLLASTFIGGSDDDYGQCIAIDGSGSVYVTGITDSSGYPITSGAYDESSSGWFPYRDVFVSKLDDELSDGMVQVVGLTTDLTGIPQVNTPMTLTVSAEGSQAVYCRFYVGSNYGAPWTEVQSWSTNNSCAYTPTTEANHVFVGHITDDPTGGGVHQAGFSFATSGHSEAGVVIYNLSTNVGFPHAAGTPINLTAQAYGSGTISYKFWCKDDIGWNVLQDWSENNTAPWTPTQAGTYIIVVWANTTPDDNVPNRPIAGFTLTVSE